MRAYASMGGGVYSGDKDYDAMTAYASREAVVRLWDRTKLCYKTTLGNVIAVGRPADVTPANEDAQLARERLPPDGTGKTNVSDWVEERRDARMAQLIAILTERGPMPLERAADLLGCNGRTVRDLLAMRDGVRIIGRRTQGGHWLGVPGQSIPDLTKQLSPRAVAIRDYLLAHGPSTAPAIARDMGVNRTTIGAILRHNPDVFAEVERRTPARGGVFVSYGLINQEKSSANERIDE